MPVRYKDLIQFEPIESVIQLRDASRPGEAKKLVSTWVVSDAMATRIVQQMIPQLSFDAAVDHMGVLIVGNYGTGKSHLMSVLSLVAEAADHVAMIRHPGVAAAAQAIAGRFRVHRIEISSAMPLRDIVTQELGFFLEKHGVRYSFPPADRVTNNKAAFEAMMAAFHAVHPEHGILLVVDEFLDYLRSRNDHDLVRDLAFLREIGEVTKHLRFRFVAGVQEALFDSSRFQHVADSLRRVKDRFTQIRLARQDVSFVVAERLLKKSSGQQRQIRACLEPFAKFYGSMNERMDEYVRLFPVHPDYIGVFERLVFTEKRGALVTLRDQIGAILDDTVPADRPGLIGYDAFWKTVTSNPVLRVDDAIGPVLRVSEVLSERVGKAFTRPAYTAMALRIIDGLSVHRLTTGGDIHVPVGPTAEELRDTLCLFQPGIEEMGGDPAADLLTAVETTLRQTLKTVNGQFISVVPDTGQYYLDLKKDVDYDARIDKRIETLAEDALDRAFFAAIRQLMGRADEPGHITGYPIWLHRVVWRDRRVEREGYLFFGAPNDRPTSQPERDFYIYFLAPCAPSRFHDDHRPDEVFFRLQGLDETLRHHLACHAAALDLASTASGSAKAIYLDKARAALRETDRWLRKRQMTAWEVTCQGRGKPLQEWVREIPLHDRLRDRARPGREERSGFRDMVNMVASLALNDRFARLAPEYPTFPKLVTRANRQQAVRNALRALTGGRRSGDAMAILDGLEMLDGDRIDPAGSRYARAVLSRLHARAPGQVLTRAALLDDGDGGAFFAPRTYSLEPDLLVTVLGGLVCSGDIVLATASDRIDAGTLTRLAERPLEQLETFRHIEAPKAINVAVLRDLFALLGQPPALAGQVARGDDAPVRRLQEEVHGLMRRVLNATADMPGQLVFWGQPLLRAAEIAAWRGKLDTLKDFCDRLTPYNTVGKLKNLRLGADEIAAQQESLEILGAVGRMLDFTGTLGGMASYLSQAAMVLAPGDPWLRQARDTRQQVFAMLAADRTTPDVAAIRQKLDRLRQAYIAAYTAEHRKVRLGTAEDNIRSALQQDSRLVWMRALADIALLPRMQVTGFEAQLDKLKSCAVLVDSDLSASPVCPHCHLRPAGEQDALLPAVDVLKHLDARLDRLLGGWVQTLVNNLADPAVQANLELLPDVYRQIVTGFARTKTLPDKVTPAFVTAFRDLLSGLEKVAVTGETIRDALFQGDSPATPADLRHRFEAFLNSHCQGKDPAKLRFVVT